MAKSDLGFLKAGYCFVHFYLKSLFFRYDCFREDTQAKVVLQTHAFKRRKGLETLLCTSVA